MSATLIETLMTTFGNDGTNHPLFRRLNLDEELYLRLGSIIKRRREHGDAELPEKDFALMLTVPFAFSAEQMGPAFTEVFKERVLHIRKTSAVQMVEELGDLFETIDSQKYIPVMSLMGNAVFGRISGLAGARESMIEDVVVDVLSENGLRRLAAESIFDVETSSGGDNLPAIFRERVAFSRAAIKKPDILILANSLASLEGEARNKMRDNVNRLMPDTTKIFIENKFLNPDNYDLFVEIVDGRIDGSTRQNTAQDSDTNQDLNRKIEEIAKTELFGKLNRKQQRLLAFGAQWYNAKSDQAIFKVGDEADAAYLCIEGSAGLYWTGDGSEWRRVSEITPGRLIGDLSVILNERRPLDLVALEDSKFLRIGSSELMAIIENDAMVASSLMRTVAGNFTGVVETLRATRTYSKERGVDFSELDKQ